MSSVEREVEEAETLHEERREELPPQSRPVHRSELLFSPRVVQPAPTQLSIQVMRDDRRIVPWGFWAGVALLVGLVLYMSFSGGMYSIWDLLWTTLLLGGLLLLAAFGRRGLSSLRRMRIAAIDLERGELALGPGESSTEVVLELGAVQEVVFGMIFYPLSHGRQDARVRAYTLMLRDGRGELVPVLEACADKEETYALAVLLSRLCQAPLSQVGAGVREEAGRPA